jgi:uncharacterized membrane protein
MDPVAQWILFALGIILIIIGAGLLVWNSVQKRATAGLADGTSDTLKAIAQLFDSVGKLVGQGAAGIGAFLILVGIALIFVPFWLPHHA